MDMKACRGEVRFLEEKTASRISGVCSPVDKAWGSQEPGIVWFPVSPPVLTGKEAPSLHPVFPGHSVAWSFHCPLKPCVMKYPSVKVCRDVV